ncbi:MAG: hypothetical protein K2H53_00120 [Clostridia bacterium]|nr:hypothetical protein [Clostridia bacterium]
MKTKVKKVIFILIILIILFSINTEVHAWSDVVGAGKTFIKERRKSTRCKWRKNNNYTKRRRIENTIRLSI